MNDQYSTIDSEKVTIRQVAKSLHPDWEFKKDWLCWPPNTFALISIILERTGCYRLCLIDTTWWRTPTWSDIVDTAAEHWLIKTTSLLDIENKQEFNNDYFAEPSSAVISIDSNTERQNELRNKAFSRFVEIIELISDQWDCTDLEHLRTINYSTKRDDTDRQLAKALLQLLAIADTACAGMGLLEKSTDGGEDPTKLSHCLANLLLTATGTLSTIPKFFGAVLPKMRTPQGGLTTRSLSHHLTFHTSEVEVMWRTMPWSNHHQKTLNIIAVPFPFEISENNFEARSERFHTVQYFSYKSTLENEEAEQQAKSYLNQVVDLVWTQSKKLDQVHILIFPESALSDSLYSYLKQKFYERLINSKPIDKEKDNIHHLPLIISGIHNGAATPYLGEEDIPGHNEVRMATFFAGKWYDIAQRKHHRWQLNSSQLIQYWLAGKLPSDRRWFEHISVGQRRLTILAPTGWFALTSLICEDLAQLEPVSSLIRGIGPTLLMALLSDGPQLNSRWSARYASVLADDPGTAVLSLTSLGMVKRSRKLANGLYVDDSTKLSAQTIALWKDMVRGDQMIDLTDDNNAVRLTISANYKEEYTLDGRSDGINAAVFQLEGYEQLTLNRQPTINSQLTQNKDSIKSQDEQQQESNHLLDDNPTSEPITSLTKSAEGDWTDIRELTALHFALDSLIELRGRNCKQICHWLLASPEYQPNLPRSLDLLLKKMAGAFKDPDLFGIDARKSSWVTEDNSTEIAIATSGIQTLFAQSILHIHFSGETSPIEYYKDLYLAAETEFNSAKNDQNKKKRIYYLVPLAVMYLIHAKVSDWKLKDIDVPNDDDIRSIVELRKDIKRFIIENQYKPYEENEK